METVRISMGDADAIDVAGAGLAFGEDRVDGPFTQVSGSRAEVRVVRGRLTLNGVSLVGDAVRFRAGERALDAGVPGVEPIRAGGRQLRGDLVVRVRAHDRLQLINVIGLEDYLVGVLGSEMPRSFPMEALKAQAVAARTYALHKKLDAYGQAWHLGSGVLAQVYGGLKAEDPRTRAAVEATRGLVLTFELAPIEAYFHASCGGRTESGLAALGRDLPYLVSVDCPCRHLPASRWAVSLSRTELESLGGDDPSSLTVISRSPTGRARRVRLSRDRSVDAVSFRARLGYERVKSLAFQVHPDGDRVRLTGTGFGHGAGLCQWGAKAMADQGWDFRHILAHYYPGTELQALY